MRYEAPWPEDEHGTAEREYCRNWTAMPYRNEWNASPARMSCQICTSCGYRWDECDFTYRGAAKVNGQTPPVAVHSVCWNCHMCETQPHQVRKFWESLDRASSPTLGNKTKETPRLRTLGDA